MMPIIMAAERDVVDSVMRRITIPRHCCRCGAPHPSTLEEVQELQRVVRMAVSTYRVKHVLDGVDAPLEESHNVPVCCSPPADDKRPPRLRGGFMPGLHIDDYGGAG